MSDSLLYDETGRLFTQGSFFLPLSAISYTAFTNLMPPFAIYGLLSCHVERSPFVPLCLFPLLLSATDTYQHIIDLDYSHLTYNSIVQDG